MTLPRNACAWMAIVIATHAAVPVTAWAQQAPRGGLAATVHFDRVGIMDANASPLRYVGGELGGALGYRRFGARWHLASEAAISAAQLRSKVSDNEDRHVETARSAMVRVALQRPIVGSAEARFRVNVGGQILAVGLSRTHEYDLGNTEEFADIFVPLQGTVGWEYRIRDNVLSGTLAMPVVALVARTPYQGLKEIPELEFATGLDARVLEHALRFENAMSASWSTRFELITLYIAHDDPRRLRLEHHRAAVSLEYRRGRRSS